MRVLEYFPIEVEAECEERPIAIMSGDLIHIVYPNGDVGFLTHQQLEDQPNQLPIECCQVWGYFEEF